LGNKRQLEDKHKYYINEIGVNETLVEKALDILVTNVFKLDKHIIKMCSAATFAAKSIFKCLNISLLPPLE
jgi:hypothetical protein